MNGNDGVKCTRCDRDLSTEELQLANHDDLCCCIQCRAALAELKTAVAKAHGGLFHTGI